MTAWRSTLARLRPHALPVVVILVAVLVANAPALLHLVTSNPLNIDTLLVGFGLPDDRVHSPNEKFDLDSFHNGTRTAAALYDRLAGL